MLLENSPVGIDIRKPEGPRERDLVGFDVGERIVTQPVHHLPAVLQPPEEHVGSAECGGFLVRQG